MFAERQCVVFQTSDTHADPLSINCSRAQSMQNAQLAYTESSPPFRRHASILILFLECIAAKNNTDSSRNAVSFEDCLSCSLKRGGR
jgi:hypothetical protein